MEKVTSAPVATETTAIAAPNAVAAPKLNATFARQYRNKTSGNMVFVYNVRGNEAGISDYQKSKGDYFRRDKDTNEVLLFSGRFEGESLPMRKSSKNEWVLDTTKIDQLSSLEQQYGIDVAKTVVSKETVVAE